MQFLHLKDERKYAVVTSDAQATLTQVKSDEAKRIAAKNAQEDKE